MIPFLTSTYLRLAGAVAVVLVVGVVIWRLVAWHSAYDELPGFKDALAREESCGDGSKCATRVANLRVQQETYDKALVENYEAKLAEIAARPVPGPVRLCRPRPADDRVRVSSASTPVSPGTGTDVPLEAGRDIAVELYRLADDADREALKLQTLWDRNVALSEGPVGQ